MAKRRRPTPDESSYDEGSASDASFTPAPKRTRTRTSTTRRKPRTTAARTDPAAASYEAGADAELACSPHSLAQHTLADTAPLRAALLAWYGGVHGARGMPWRVPYDAALGREGRAQRAYEVWVSEIMLQQTQVATVIPYYTRWMARFPTLKDLAAADLETVNALWKGLGYYSRAARLLQGAQKAVAELGGRLPDNARDMEAQVPGVGRYSAGAICSIAYNECVPVLDGNVHRLLSRVLALHAPPKAKATLDVLWAGAEAMVEGAAAPGDVNQALIELGATVCKVREPACAACPLQPWCGAYAHAHAPEAAGDVPDIEDACTLCAPLARGAPASAFPMKAVRKKAREERDVVCVVEWRDPHRDARWFLLVRRPDGGLLAGLHEFPTAPDVAVSGLTASAMHATAHTLLAGALQTPPPPYARGGTRTTAVQADGLRIAHIKPAGDVVHVFSHIRKTYRVQWVLLEGGAGVPALAPVPAQTAAPKKGAKRARKSHPEELGEGVEGAEGAPPRAMWRQLEDVPAANIGTGVLKVWRQVSTLWDGAASA